ncbi:MAG TPA: polymer-forming cytoskeletal protein, partial [Alphaproteobacteria bacterium]|nr:polymer-forming cytoskeletal protein [Alphaproteobacteria bacterium]
FHRPGVPAAARPASPYAPVYGAPTGFTPHTSLANDPALANGRKLVVGEGINLSGEIEACDHLIVEGKVEAALKGARVLDIAETGVFYGTVEIDEATIAGRFEGDLTVNGRLTIRATGSITGAIAYKELAVEAGATLDGKISPVRDRGEARKQQPQDPSRARNAIDPSIYKARKDDMTSSLRGPAFAQSGTELPFSEKETAAAE